LDSGGQRAGVRADLAYPPGRADGHLGAGGAFSGGAFTAEHLAHVVRHRLVVEHRAFEQLEDLAVPGLAAVFVVVFVALVRFRHVDRIELQLEVFVGGPAAGSGGCRHQLGGLDGAEPPRWVGDCGSALGHLE
jgi:hypothetical protein